MPQDTPKKNQGKKILLLLGKSPLEGVLLLLKINLSTETHLEMVSSMVWMVWIFFCLWLGITLISICIQGGCEEFQPVEE